MLSQLHEAIRMLSLYVQAVDIAPVDGIWAMVSE
jgi:hypothetical protein